MNRKSIRVALLCLGALPLLAGSLSACNTVKGAGQDLKAAGQAIERKAEQKKHY
ncbi:MAG: entericidin A/B family lipoprotein [Candidatus Contendobacter sp.]|nr:entericidin A/B family lipoprotein [Candidatus Contendobacter sp.]